MPSILEAIYSFITKVKIAKDIHLPFYLINFLPTLNWFRLNLPPQMAGKITFANEYLFFISTFATIEEMASVFFCMIFSSAPVIVAIVVFFTIEI